MSSYFCISTRRVSISLYQRARYSSFVQGTLPASHQSLSPTNDIFQESTKGELPKQVPKKKPKSSSHWKAPQIFYEEPSIIYDEETVAAMQKEDEEFCAAFDSLPKDISKKDLDEFLAEWF
ncbi:hypothetical protein P8452_68368 [Trifolium repens]|nr:hypothetical protein P8452_68368 [Trifolium repens]